MKRQAFDAATLRMLEDLCESTWVIWRRSALSGTLQKTMIYATNFAERSSSSLKIQPNRFGCAAKVGSRGFRPRHRRPIKWTPRPAGEQGLRLSCRDYERAQSDTSFKASH